MPLTKRLRAYYAGKYMHTGGAHLDIGCGDGYFMKMSKCGRVYGFDAKYGDVFEDALDFPDNYFDYVTMLAVIEHLPNPERVFQEVYRVLKPGGRFIFTTPKQKGERLIKLYAKDIGQLHCRHYDLRTVKEYSRGLFKLSGYRTFLFGLNQVYCLIKGSRDER